MLARLLLTLTTHHSSPPRDFKENSRILCHEKWVDAVLDFGKNAGTQIKTQFKIGLVVYYRAIYVFSLFFSRIEVAAFTKWLRESE